MQGNGEKQHESSDEIWAPPVCAGKWTVANIANFMICAFSANLFAE